MSRSADTADACYALGARSAVDPARAAELAQGAHAFAFEIGVEEVPAFDLARATDQLERMVPEDLAHAGLSFDGVEVLSTPRRLIVFVGDLAGATEARTERFKGPKVQIAFDADGEPTKAAVGFARGKGLSADELERATVDGVEYVFATRTTPAIPALELLPGLCRGWIEKLKWPRSQRWATYPETFVRPVRWLLALLDDCVVPLAFAGAVSGNRTFGHRVLAPGAHEVPNARALVDAVRAAAVVPSQAERERVIRAGVARIEEETGLSAELPDKTLREVVNLSEFPTPLLGTFDEEFLEVPPEIIVDAMLMHQRYFPLYDSEGALTNRFVIVSNGDPACSDIIRDGNERVVRARLDDAKFFYEEDLALPLEAYVARLDDVVFQESLGTVRQKAQRLSALAPILAADAGLSADDARDLERACYLCKADLVTSAVVEFTSVQGVMGGYYAQAAGETEQVARAVREHYQPRFSGDALPSTEVGRLVALADKLDTICGLFAVGQAPTGSHDPFALRRAAIGIVSLLAAGLPVSLAPAVDAALANYAEQGVAFDAAAVRAAVIDFFVTRTKVMLVDEGIASDAVEAVVACGVEEPAQIARRAHALRQARADQPDTFEELSGAYARANNLRDAQVGTQVDESLLGDVERALVSAVARAEERVPASLAADDYEGALAQLASLRGPIDAFFDAVLVMDEDAVLRANRLALLNRFVGVFARVADFGKMAKAVR